MKKSLVAIMVLGVLLLASCTNSFAYVPITSGVATTPVTTTEPVSTETTAPLSGSYGDIDIYKISEGSFGVYGSLRVNNYQAGIAIDKNIQGYEPLYIMNRVNRVSEMKSITTEIGETIADIPINRILHNGDLSSILSITSDLAGETLTAEKYNFDGTLAISGFTPNMNRIATFTYIPDSMYSVKCNYNGKPEAGYVQAPPEVMDWVTFDQEYIVVSPDSIAPIWVNMTVPKGTELPDKWMFWIEITLSAGKNVGGVATQIVYKVGFKVDMR